MDNGEHLRHHFKALTSTTLHFKQTHVPIISDSIFFILNEEKAIMIVLPVLYSFTVKLVVMCHH